MTKTCKSFLFSIGLLLSSNGLGFIFKIDHYVNNSGQHIYLFADMHMLIENGKVKKQEYPNKVHRNSIVKAAVENGAFVIVEDIFFMFDPQTGRMFTDPKINEPEQMYIDLLTSPKTFNKNKDYSQYFAESFFTESCPDEKMIPLTYLSQLCRKKKVPVENVDSRILLLSSFDGATINGSDVFHEIERDYEKLVQFSKENNPFASIIKNKLITYDTIRTYSAEFRNQVIKINKPLYQSVFNINFYKKLDDLYRLLVLYDKCECIKQLGLSKELFLQKFNAILDRVIDICKIPSLLLLHDALLIDMNILHSIYRHLTNKTIFVCAGADHIYYTKEALEQLGYKKIDAYGSEVKYKDLMDEGYAEPINIDKYFAKNQNSTHLNPEKETPVQDICAVCGKTGAKYRCGNCKQVDYCSQDCQRKDWTNHKKVCKK